MKANSIIILSLVTVMTLVCSCDQSLVEENKKLKADLTLMTKDIDKTRAEAMAEALKILQLSRPIDTNTAKLITNQFRTSHSLIRIPVSWEFDKDQLKALVTASQCKESLRFYAAFVVDTPAHGLKDTALSLIAVAVDDKNRDIFFLPDPDGGTVEVTALYEFAKPCPTKCGVTNTVLNPVVSTQSYHYFRRVVPYGLQHGQAHPNTANK